MPSTAGGSFVDDVWVCATIVLAVATVGHIALQVDTGYRIEARDRIGITRACTINTCAETTRLPTLTTVARVVEKAHTA